MTKSATCVSRSRMSLSSVSTSRRRLRSTTTHAATRVAVSTATCDESPDHTQLLLEVGCGHNSSPGNAVPANLTARSCGDRIRTAAGTSRHQTEETHPLVRRMSRVTARCVRQHHCLARQHEGELERLGTRSPADSRLKVPTVRYTHVYYHKHNTVLKSAKTVREYFVQSLRCTVRSLKISLYNLISCTVPNFVATVNICRNSAYNRK